MRRPTSTVLRFWNSGGSAPAPRRPLPYLIGIITSNTTKALRDLPYKGEFIDALGAVGKDNPIVIATLQALFTLKRIGSPKAHEGHRQYEHRLQAR